MQVSSLGFQACRLASRRAASCPPQEAGGSLSLAEGGNRAASLIFASLEADQRRQPEMTETSHSEFGHNLSDPGFDQDQRTLRNGGYTVS
jgi:hypothetical protein